MAPLPIPCVVKTENVRRLLFPSIFEVIEQIPWGAFEQRMPEK